MDKLTETKKFYHLFTTLPNSHESSIILQRDPKINNKKPVIDICNEQYSS